MMTSDNTRFTRYRVYMTPRNAADNRLIVLVTVYNGMFLMIADRIILLLVIV